MNAAQIEKIWSVEKKLTAQKALTESDYQSLLQLIHASYGSLLPQKREVVAAQEAARLTQQTTSENTTAFFEAQVQSLETKYAIPLYAFSDQL
ncbi:hypothetical protein [Enterococcus sp. 5H]|uniref:hypothetical protein n=1 Tax=Enterococcus sp. 5H TaxID=1229490 RepID=UPI0023033A93|nr:hypothetical protein [Enterococcus sp. 5H]MDA9470772.1 hypothetical protein [Enterococcus sp. 5H]